ncbi:hypothetical protein GCM10007092_13120 [Thermus composti]|nr:hypothetical protein GCM10007092_13120 [Thermus composti]
MGELDPPKGGPFLQDPFHPKPPFPVASSPEPGEGENLGESRKKQKGQEKAWAHTPQANGEPSG